MIPEHDPYEADLALLLDTRQDGPDAAAARARLVRDPVFRQEYESLNRLGKSLEALGETLHNSLGTIDLRQDVRDSIAHHAMEELAMVDASPFQDVERALGALKADFDAAAGEVSLVSDVMAAVAASRKSDEEVDRAFPRETVRLRALGQELAANTPPVELVEPVLAQVEEHRPVNVVPLRGRATAAGSVRVAPVRARRPWLVAAAAAAVISGVGLVLYHAVLAPGLNRDLRQAVGPNVVPAPDSGGDEQAPPRMAQAPPPLSVPPVVDGEKTSDPERGVRNEAPPLTLQDVINEQRRDMVNNTRAVAALASLSEADAIELLRSMNLSVEALIGATEFLSTEEAIAALRAAIAEHPDDPNLRYALAQKLGEDPAFAEERLDQLTQLAAKDTTNGLPHFMMASEYFDRGDTAQGLDALTRGSAYSESSAYALEAARQREATLVASGVPADVARFLALSNAGEAEYGDIGALRNELLDYGAYYEEQGDFETASQIYQAVSQLGQQVAAGADLAAERQAGLETQQEAIIAIQEIAEAFQKPEIAAMLGDQLTLLATGIAEVAQYIQARQEMILNPGLSASLDWTALLNRMITEGDMNISDLLR